jgi:hypothetical protein
MSHQATAPKQIKMKKRTTTEKEQQRHNSICPKGWVLRFKDSFVEKQALIFKSSFVVKSPPFG